MGWVCVWALFPTSDTVSGLFSCPHQSFFFHLQLTDLYSPVLHWCYRYYYYRYIIFIFHMWRKHETGVWAWAQRWLTKQKPKKKTHTQQGQQTWHIIIQLLPVWSVQHRRCWIVILGINSKITSSFRRESLRCHILFLRGLNLEKLLAIFSLLDLTKNKRE